jgi:hypothetical protein
MTIFVYITSDTSSNEKHGGCKRHEIEGVLTRVYNIRDYWVFGFCPAFVILRKKHRFEE